MAKFMYCTNCGKELTAGCKFCGNCGAKAPDYSANEQTEEKPYDKTEELITDVPAAEQTSETVKTEPEQTAQEQAVQEQPTVRQAFEQTEDEPVKTEDGPEKAYIAPLGNVYSYTSEKQTSEPAPEQIPVREYAGGPANTVRIDPRYKPLGVGAYIGISLLMLIPVVNIILLFVWAFAGGINYNRRNYARAALIIWLVVLIISTALAAALIWIGVQFGEDLLRILDEFISSLNF